MGQPPAGNAFGRLAECQQKPLRLGRSERLPKIRGVEDATTTEPDPDRVVLGALDQQQGSIEGAREGSKGIYRADSLGDRAKMMPAEVVGEFVGVDEFTYQETLDPFRVALGGRGQPGARLAHVLLC